MVAILTAASLRLSRIAVDPPLQPRQISGLYSPSLQDEFCFDAFTLCLSGQVVRQNHSHHRDARLNQPQLAGRFGRVPGLAGQFQDFDFKEAGETKDDVKLDKTR